MGRKLARHLQEKIKILKEQGKSSRRISITLNIPEATIYPYYYDVPPTLLNETKAIANGFQSHRDYKIDRAIKNGYSGIQDYDTTLDERRRQQLPNIIFSLLLRNYLKKNNYTFIGLGKEIGVTKKAISRYARGSYLPNEENLRELLTRMIPEYKPQTPPLDYLEYIVQTTVTSIISH